MARKPIQYNPGQQALETSAPVVDTYYRPQVADLGHPDGNAGRLAAALGVQLQQAGNAYLSREQNVQLLLADNARQQAKEEAERQAKIQFAKLGFEDVKKARSEGTLYPADDPFLGMAMERQFGLTAARNIQEDVTRRLTPGEQDSFDLNTLDVEQTIQSYTQGALFQIGDNKFAQGGFGDELGRIEGNVRRLLKTAKSGQIAQEAEQAVFANIDAAIKAGIDSGRTTEEIAASVRGTYTGHRDAFGITPQMQDKILLEVAAKYAAAEGGNYSLVSHLLNDERQGTGAISGKRELAAKSITILEAARKQKVEKDQKDTFEIGLSLDRAVESGALTEDRVRDVRTRYPNAFTDHELRARLAASNSNAEQIRKEKAREALKLQNAQTAQTFSSRLDASLRQLGNGGRLDTLPLTVEYPKESGEIGTYSADQLRERAVRNFLEIESPALAKLNHETPEQTHLREVAWFTRETTVDNPKWRTLLTSGFAAASFPTVTPDELLKNPQYERAQALYESLWTKNPNLLRNHLKNSAATDFYEAVRVFKQYGTPELGAIQNALQATRDPTNFDAASRKIRTEELRKYTNDLRRTGKFLMFGENVSNMGEVGTNLERLAEKYSLMGLSPEDSVREATHAIQATHTNVNGYMAYTGDQRIPPDFRQSVEKHIQQFAKANNLDPDALTVQTLGNATSAWRVVFKGNPISPVSDSTTAGYLFTLADLAKAKEKELAEKKAGIADEVNSGGNPFSFGIEFGPYQSKYDPNAAPLGVTINSDTIRDAVKTLDETKMPNVPDMVSGALQSSLERARRREAASKQNKQN